MKYNFYIQKISKSIIYSIKIEEPEYYVLENFTDVSWTSERIQEIIDGVKSTDNTEKEYRWGNEDIIVVSNKHAVFFIDLLSTRGSGKQVREKQDLDLTHVEFIKFLEDFKEFIENKKK
jgi:hypothetical protein